jgi:hypothetical protein
VGPEKGLQIEEVKQMKKIIVFMMLVLFLVVGFVNAGPQAIKKSKQERSVNRAVTRTYNLKYVSPQVVKRTLKQYFYDASYSDNVNMITVTIATGNIATFEKHLKDLDVEKKKVMLRIFTVIASKEGKSGPIDNPDLRKVLGELQKVLSFKAFHLDGVSALTVSDGQRRSQLMLASKSKLDLRLSDIVIRRGAQGTSVAFEFILSQLMQPVVVKDGRQSYESLIRSKTSVKEDGYLVAGVSRIGENGDSLVLVINAKML